MIVEQIWTANAGRNFNYLVACGETGETLAIDPLDHQKCLAAAKAKGWTITQILNTHEHHDHTGGNQQVIAATGARSRRTPTRRTGFRNRSRVARRRCYQSARPSNSNA